MRFEWADAPARSRPAIAPSDPRSHHESHKRDAQNSNTHPQLATYKSDGSLSEVDAFRTGLDHPQTNAARIPLGRFRGPVVLVSGGQDQLWPSADYARQIMAGLRAGPGAHVNRVYPRAGHVVLEIPYQPPLIESSVNGHTLALGVDPAADDAAHEQDWPATIAFIKSH